MRRQTILKLAALRAVVVGMLILFSTSGYAIAEINQQNDIKNKTTELSSRPNPHNNYNPALCNPLRRSLCNFEYYVGFDLKRRRMPYEKNLGSNIMPKVIPEYGVFVGVKFNEYFGLEFGASQSKKTITKDFVEDEITFNVEANSDIEKHRAKYRMQYFYADLVLYSQKFAKGKIQLYCSLGVARKTLHIKHTFVSLVVLPLPEHSVDISDDIKRMKYIPHIAAGINLEITPTILFRIATKWSRTKSFGIIIDDVNNGIDYKASPRNSLTTGVGIVFTM